MKNPQQPYQAVLFFMALVGLTLLIYSQGWSGGWHFDDLPNLQALGGVFSKGFLSIDAALEFVFSGDAGPLGRPLALASFLIDGSAWSNDPRAFLYTNTLLHCVNALILFCVLYRLGGAKNFSNYKAAWLSALGAGLWMIMPLSVSGVLMTVQRMTVLSSTFMLLSIWCYLIARDYAKKNIVVALIGMASSLCFGTLIGIFTKEQACITPLLIWVVEAYWLNPLALQSNRQRVFWKLFRFLFFYTPALIIAAYLSSIVWYAKSTYSLRDFEIDERLWTQSIILWDYLRLAFFPRAVALGPFHDDYKIYDESHFLAWVAVSAWVIVFVTAWKVRVRTKLPLLALLWFFVSHLVESTVVPLELYFEHRNYIALIMPVFVLVVSAWGWAEKGKSVINYGNSKYFIIKLGIVFGILFLMLSVVLWQLTSLFGQPPVAAQMWYEQHSKSIRAAQFFAQKLVENNNLIGALKVLDSTAQVRENSAALSLQGLQLACVLGASESDLQKRFDLVLRELPVSPQRFSIVQTLDKLKTLYQRKSCHGFIQQEHLLAMAKAALKNPRISAAAQERSNLHVFMASLFIDARQLEPTMKHLLAALDAVPSLQNLQITLAVLKSAGIGEGMTEIIANHPLQYPRNPWLKKRLEKEWQALQKELLGQQS